MPTAHVSTNMPSQVKHPPPPPKTLFSLKLSPMKTGVPKPEAHLRYNYSVLTRQSGGAMPPLTLLIIEARPLGAEIDCTQPSGGRQEGRI